MDADTVFQIVLLALGALALGGIVRGGRALSVWRGARRYRRKAGYAEHVQREAVHERMEDAREAYRHTNGQHPPGR